MAFAHRDTIAMGIMNDDLSRKSELCTMLHDNLIECFESDAFLERLQQIHLVIPSVLGYIEECSSWCS